jgi:hypothetical protein
MPNRRLPSYQPVNQSCSDSRSVARIAASARAQMLRRAAAIRHRRHRLCHGVQCLVQLQHEPGLYAVEVDHHTNLGIGPQTAINMTNQSNVDY